MNDQIKFTFKRKQEKKNLLQGTVKDDINDDKEYINSSSDITHKPKKRKRLIIPSKGNAWKPESVKDELTRDAMNEILSNPSDITADAPRLIDSADNNKTSSLKFPGVVPQKESTLDDYGDIPISEFGAALMRGMGWEKGRGIGKKRQLVEPVDFALKKRTLGVTIHEEEAAEADRRFHEFKLGDYIEVAGGHDKGKHAKILSLSLETSRCIVRLPSEEMVDLAIINIIKGDREEYLRQRDQEAASAPDIFNGNHQHVEDKKPSKLPEHSNGATQKKPKKAWLHQDLLVRVVSRDFADGKYYCKKVTIVDIIDPFTCVCRSESGKLLEDVPQSILETVIPKKKGTLIMLLSKQNRFQVAELEEKDSKSQSVICLTLIEKEVIVASFDEVCHYVGDAVR